MLYIVLIVFMLFTSTNSLYNYNNTLMAIEEEENKKHSSEDDDSVHFYFLTSSYNEPQTKNFRISNNKSVIPYHLCIIHNHIIEDIDIPPES